MIRMANNQYTSLNRHTLVLCFVSGHYPKGKLLNIVKSAFCQVDPVV